MKIKIAFFSGTGSTRYVAESFKKEIEARNHTVHMLRIGKEHANSKDTYDLLIICYAVHACNAPKPVFDWVEDNDSLAHVPTAIISVSGGGEVTPNLACRFLIKKALEKKECPVFYEKMIVMPSNWIVASKSVLIDKLLDVLPYKVSRFVDDMVKGKTSLSKPGPGNRLFSRVGMLEHHGAIHFGKRLKVRDICNGCGLCEGKCPVENIRMHQGKPEFQNHCTLCLQCIYSCPRNAISPGLGKSVVIKEGYDFGRMLKERRKNVEIDIRKEAKGFLWLGVKRYLLNSEEMLEPAYKGADSGSNDLR